jgi:hypothetical protein
MSSLEGAKKASVSLPPYSEGQDGEADTPPQYRDATTSNQAEAPAKSQGPTPPFGRFPPVISVYGSFISKTLHLCGADKTDRLYAVELHTGYSMKWPLGLKPGLYLRKSLSYP